MSTRSVPRSLDERVATLEQWVRSLQVGTAEAPTDTRFLYQNRGELLMAGGAGDPSPLGPGTFGDVLTMTNQDLAEWRDPDRIRRSAVAVRGSLLAGSSPGVVSVLAPGPDGLVLTADSSRPTGLRWA